MNTKMIVQRVKPMRQTVRLLLLLAAIDCIGATTAWLPQSRGAFQAHAGAPEHQEAAL
jgi:hypothetical protein